MQTWALYTTINKLGHGSWQAIFVDYCPNTHLNSNPLNPIEQMWDQDEESIKMCQLSLPSIEKNFYKFEDFYNNNFLKTKHQYNSSNFNEIIKEKIDGYVCGSDTIFCIDEFGFDDGYYSNYSCMKEGYSVSYAASFGDSHFDQKSLIKLDKLIQNFDYIALRENFMLNHINEKTTVPVKKVLDPTLLLSSEDYDTLAAPKQEMDKYLLLYARRNNEKMSDFAEELAKKNGWKIIEISLKAINAEKHRMFYEAGVEEFLSLVKHAEFVVTNSFHGIIFSILYSKQFYAFSREQADSKIYELLDLLKLSKRIIADEVLSVSDIDYDKVHQIIKKEREKSLNILETELNNCK